MCARAFTLFFAALKTRAHKHETCTGQTDDINECFEISNSLWWFFHFFSFEFIRIIHCQSFTLTHFASFTLFCSCRTKAKKQGNWKQKSKLECGMSGFRFSTKFSTLRQFSKLDFHLRMRSYRKSFQHRRRSYFTKTHTTQTIWCRFDEVKCSCWLRLILRCLPTKFIVFRLSIGKFCDVLTMRSTAKAFEQKKFINYR